MPVRVTGSGRVGRESTSDGLGVEDAEAVKIVSEVLKLIVKN